MVELDAPAVEMGRAVVLDRQLGRRVGEVDAGQDKAVLVAHRVLGLRRQADAGQGDAQPGLHRGLGPPVGQRDHRAQVAGTAAPGVAAGSNRPTRGRASTATTASTVVSRRARSQAVRTGLVSRQSPTVVSSRGGALGPDARTGAPAAGDDHLDGGVRRCAVGAEQQRERRRVTGQYAAPVADEQVGAAGAGGEVELECGRRVDVREQPLVRRSTQLSPGDRAGPEGLGASERSVSACTPASPRDPVSPKPLPRDRRCSCQRPLEEPWCRSRCGLSAGGAAHGRWALQAGTSAAAHDLRTSHTGSGPAAHDVGRRHTCSNSCAVYGGRVRAGGGGGGCGGGGWCGGGRAGGRSACTCRRAACGLWASHTGSSPGT
jgi:hypothetical protein